MIRQTSRTLRKVQVSGPTLRRVDPAKVARALGAERTGQPVSTRQSPAALFGLRQALASRLRSRGGRPSLGLAQRQKIPLAEADWKMLHHLAQNLSKDGVHPTPGQVASELLREKLHQVCRAIGPDPTLGSHFHRR